MRHVAFSADENFSWPLIMAINSYCSTNAEPTVIHVLYEELSEQSLNDLRLLVATFPDKILQEHQVEPGSILTGSCCAVPAAAACYRYFLVDLLHDCDQVLYLDCDLLVRGDLQEIFSLTLGDHLAAAIRDPWMPSTGWDQKLQKEYGIDFYFNSGVMFFNLAAMRSGNIKNILLDLDSKGWPYRDQDVLNIALRKRVVELPEKFNLIEPNRTSPETIITHFTGATKPWLIATTPAHTEWMMAAETLAARIAELGGSRAHPVQRTPIPNAPAFNDIEAQEWSAEYQKLASERRSRKLSRTEEQNLINLLIKLNKRMFDQGQFYSDLRFFVELLMHKRLGGTLFSFFSKLRFRILVKAAKTHYHSKKQKS